MKSVTLEDFRAQNPKDWKQLIDQLFPAGIPQQQRWESQDEIIRVLNHMGSIANVNHLFFASGGGLDLTGAGPGSEEGQTELVFDYSRRVCQIESLTFDSFGDTEDYQWCYFRIETVPLASIFGSSIEGEHLQEEVTELRPGEYAPRADWDNRYDDEDNPLPNTARLLVRLLSGSMVIFQKSGAYNGAPATYNAPHNLVNADDFRKFVGVIRQAYQEKFGGR